VIRLDTLKVRLLMLALHLAAIPTGIVLGRWVFHSVT
jgi:hypothetical protein